MSAKKKNPQEHAEDATEPTGAAEDAAPAAVPPGEAFRALIGLTQDNAEKPGFARLKRSYEAFETGDYPTARRVASELAADSAAASEVRDGAAKLLEAVNLDRTSLFIAAACSLIFILILVAVY